MSPRAVPLPGGPWRVAVAEWSMAPALEPGDWLITDPRVRDWPPPGAVVLLREPGSGELVVKRVVARAPATVATEFGPMPLDEGEAWVEGDAAASHDSRHYGPVPRDRLVARVVIRYWPPRRAGRVGGAR